MASTETKAPAPAGARAMPETDNTMDDNTTTETTAPAYEMSQGPAGVEQPANPYGHLTREELEGALSRATERMTILSERVTALRDEQLEGGDARLTEFWSKAERVASHAGFCSEYDRMADALGGPARMLEWEGATSVTLSLTFTVPVGGVATPAEIDEHTMSYDMDDDTVLEHAKEYLSDARSWYVSNDWTTDDSDLEVHRTERVSN